MDRKAQIKELRDKIDMLERQQRQEDALVQGMAIELHDLLCRYNHTDQCAWLYEVNSGVHNWDKGDTHIRYFNKASEFLAEFNEEDGNFAVHVIHTLRKYR